MTANLEPMIPSPAALAALADQDLERRQAAAFRAIAERRVGVGLRVDRPELAFFTRLDRFEYVPIPGAEVARWSSRRRGGPSCDSHDLLSAVEAALAEANP